MKKITLINIFSNIILQITYIITWFFIPKLILMYFGSEVNGLVSSITQFLSYISLIEGGVTGVVMASLYKPLVTKDNEKISSIIKTSNKFYKKISLIFILYSLFLALLYPLIFNTKYSFIYIFSLVLISSISLLIQYMYSITLKTLLNADKKCFVVSLTQTIVLIISMVLSYVSVKIYPNIHLLKLLSAISFIIQPIIYHFFTKKWYKINYNAKEDKNLLKQRWNGFAINIASFIHNSTDITVLTIFTNLKVVSVYSVYSIVTTGLRSVYNAISNALVPVIGHAYAKKDFKVLNEKLDIYEFITFNFVFYIFSIASLLITPFVMLYIGNINDANYNQYAFGILMIVSEGLYLIKFPHLNLSYSANKFKDLTLPAFIEAIINILVSLIFVYRYDLIGVTLGTISGMLYRMIYQVYFTKKMNINRKQSVFYKKLFIYIIFSITGIIFCNYFIPTNILTVKEWLINGIIYAIIFGLLFGILNIIFNRKELLYFKNYLKKRR